MKIFKTDLIEIIENQIQKLSEEQETFMSQQFAEEAKKILIAIEFFSKIFNSVIDAIKDPKSLSDFVDNILSMTEYKKIMSDVHHVTSTNEKILLIKKHIISGSDLLTMFGNNIRGLNLSVPEDLEKFQFAFFGKKGGTSGFIKDANYFKKFLEDARLKSRQLFNYTGSNKESSGDLIPPSILEAVSDLEKLAFNYLSEIEKLFFKIYSIKTEIDNSKKQWSDYELMNTRGAAKDIVNFQNTLKNDINADFPKTNLKFPEEDTFNAYARGRAERNAPEKTSQLNFNLSKFINSIYKGSFSSSNDIEVKKAQQIQVSLNKITVFNKKTIPNTLSHIHSVLWNPKTKKYYFDRDIFTIFHNMRISRGESSRVLNQIFSGMEKAVKSNQTTEDYFKSNHILIDAFIKRIQFLKIELKNVFLQIVTNKKADIKDPKIATDISAEQEKKIQQRLHYWNLFKQLGWTKDSAPSWLYR